MKQKGIFYTSASAILFGITPMIIMKAYAYGVSSLTVVFYRCLFATIILALLCKKKHICFTITKKQLLSMILVTCLGSGLTTIILTTSYEYIDTGTATSLHFLYPIFVALMCRLFFHETLGKQKCCSLFLAFIGMIFFLSGAQGGNFNGYILAILSSVTYAFYMVFLEKLHLAQLEPYLLSFYIGLIGTLQTLVYHLINPQISFILPVPAYCYLILVAICSSFLAVMWLQKGIYYLGSTTASLFCLFEPITSLIVGVLFMGESLSIAKIIASVLIIIALLYMSIAPSAQMQKNKSIVS